MSSPLPAAKRVIAFGESYPRFLPKRVLVPCPGKTPSIKVPQFIVRSYLEDDLHGLHGLKD